MKTKHTLRGYVNTREVYLDGEYLSPKESQKIWNHSPDGFNWGYGGSGPSQLALAIFLRLFKSTYITCDDKQYSYQDFKWDVIAKIPQKDFEIEFEI